jgi:hypothetical protein
LVAGICFVAIGIVANEWVFKSLVSDPSVIGTGKRSAILVLQAGLLGLGALLIWRREKLPVAQMALAAFMAVLSLVAAELALRAVGGQTDFNVFRLNPHGTGSYRLIPNLDYDVHVTVLGKQVTFEIATNSHGMRWREVSKKKPSGKKRIAFLGDSFTFGESADRVENSFTGIFELQLDQDVYEVLNFGVDGYGIDDMELYLKEEVIQFEPDYCIVMFFAGNDFRDTYLGLNKFDTSSGIAVWNQAVIEEKIPPALRGGRFYGGTVGGKKSQRDSIRIYRLAQNAWRKIRDKSREPEPIETFDPTVLTIEPQFTSFSFWTQSEYDDSMLAARDATLQAFDRIRAFCADRGIGLMIAAIPMQAQVYSATWQGIDPGGVAFDIRRPQVFVEGFAAEQSIPYLDLLEPLRAYVTATQRDIFPSVGQKGGDIHLNNEGHAVVGRLLAEFFERTFVPNASVGD